MGLDRKLFSGKGGIYGYEAELFNFNVTKIDEEALK